MKVHAVAKVRLDADGRRFVARGDDRDAALLDLLTSPEPIGDRR